MAMQQLQKQLEMNAAQPWQQQQQQPTQQYQNNNKNSNRGRKIRGNNNNNSNGGVNQPMWSTNISKFNRKTIPNNVRSNKTPKYCWTHGHNTRHNSNKFSAQCAGHKNNATTHVNIGVNPNNAERVLSPSAVGITGIDVRACGQIQQQPSWDHQANMGYCMPTHHPMIIQQPMMHTMIQQPMMQQQQQQQQQQQPQYDGMIIPTQQFMGGHNQQFNRMWGGFPWGATSEKQRQIVHWVVITQLILLFVLAKKCSIHTPPHIFPTIIIKIQHLQYSAHNKYSSIDTNISACM